MLQYTYEIQRPVANTPGKRRNLFGYEATLQQATEVQPEQTWPDKEHVILVQQLLLDTRSELDTEMHAWVDSASAGQKLEICFRSIRVVWKSGRAFVQAPDGHVQAALDAILDYALLARAIANAEEQARTLGDQMLQLMQHNESRLQIPSLRKYLNEATQLALNLVDIRPYCELPARTGEVTISTRLRTELLTQAQTSDGLDLLEHRLEIVLDGLEAQLQRTQESWRGTLETWIGLSILALLVLDYIS
mgnify:FL=1